jgi:hypothetical protein
MVVEYFRAHIRSNTEIFELAPFLGAPFYQHVMFEAVAITTLCIPLAIFAAWRRSPALTADVFNLFTLALALIAFLGFYFDSEASISRVTAPFVLLVLLVYVATDVRRWIVAGVIATNLLVAPSFLAVYRVWRTDLFVNDQSRYQQFRDQLTPWLAFDSRRTSWCNTLLTTTYAREIVAVPAGIGLSVGRPATELTPPIKSGYVLLTPDSIHDFGDKAQLQHLATTVLGELYSNRDAACH